MEDFLFKKAYGQNFLKDNNVITNIVSGANILPNSLIIEVGPGSGALTKELAKVSKNVLCYEIDDRLEDILDENLLGLKNVEIIFDDFLNRDINDDIKKYTYDNVYLVANLPYYITTPIILKVFKSKVNFKIIIIV